MYELTVMSIFRDSTGYIDRYVSQLSEIVDFARDVHFIWITGDNKDATIDQLSRAADTLPDQADVTIVEFDTHGPYWPSADIPARWRQLESVWNETLAHYTPSEYAIAVESELVWDWSTLSTCLNTLADGAADVIAPALWYRPIPGKFYDTHAFRTLEDSKEFSPFMPWYTGFNADQQFVKCKTVGGLIVAKGQAMETAKWTDDCRLTFDPKYNIVADMKLAIYHP